ncbi:hypothetical protein VNO78_33614 [Psophocarpus tetragonolobus]|uniref:Uncharacterized protein n=1 Tax=Psophocarpus tetragonolobus TaxID=3891 RepID=A0AAN9NXA6_PSOTE
MRKACVASCGKCVQARKHDSMLEYSAVIVGVAVNHELFVNEQQCSHDVVHKLHRDQGFSMEQGMNLAPKKSSRFPHDNNYKISMMKDKPMVRRGRSRKRSKPTFVASIIIGGQSEVREIEVMAAKWERYR